MELKERVGEKAGPYEERIEASRLSAFCAAVGTDDSGEASPTFLTVFRQGEFHLFEKLGLPLSRVLHAEQEYIYEGKIVAGDLIAFTTTLTQANGKTGTSGMLYFLTFETVFQAKRQGSDLGQVATARTTVVVR